MNEFTQKNPLKYECKICDFNSINKKDYNRHLGTAKHKKRVFLNHFEQENPQTYIYMCKKCNKTYKGRNGLWYHEQKCGIDNNTSQNELTLMSGMMLELVKSNNDLQKQVIDVCQKIQPNNTNNTNSHNTTTTTTTQSHNKTFNLQFFLNEECKDAMNLSEFIKSIEVTLSDLENIGKLGYVEGMSDIIIKQLKDTEVNKRPVHCSDSKRETLYVKEENKWEKDTKQMARAVKEVDKKNYKALTSWKDANPKCTDSASIQSDEYINVVSEVMDGDEGNVDKVIKKVAKQVVIGK